jgi:hypothetical protein
MDSSTEKYPVCPERNTAAAFRWFYQPLSVLAFLKGRPASRPSVAVPAPDEGLPARTPDRGLPARMPDRV